MAKKVKKLLKAHKPTDLDLAKKAKRTGYRFKTQDVAKLHKKNGDLNKKGEELYFAKPTNEEIKKFKRKPDGSYASDVKEVYHERRADRKHSDDTPKKKFKKGGAVKRSKAGIAQDKRIKAMKGGKRTSADGNTYYEYREDHSDKDLRKKFATGGGIKKPKVKQNPAQSESYSKKLDKEVKSKPVGKRFTNELADELGKSHNATPTKKEVEEYLGEGVYDEKRKDKSDVSLKDKFEGGGETEKVVEISVEDMKVALGREPRYPYDFIDGKKYTKCFMRPYYKFVD